jgi:urea transport system ATP-binding protein
MAILLVEQYFDFVHEFADHFAVMDRGHIILTASREEMDPDKMRRHLTV